MESRSVFSDDGLCIPEEFSSFVSDPSSTRRRKAYPDSASCRPYLVTEQLGVGSTSSLLPAKVLRFCNDSSLGRSGKTGVAGRGERGLKSQGTAIHERTLVPLTWRLVPERRSGRLWRASGSEAIQLQVLEILDWLVAWLPAQLFGFSQANDDALSKYTTNNKTNPSHRPQAGPYNEPNKKDSMSHVCFARSPSLTVKDTRKPCAHRDGQCPPRCSRPAFRASRHHLKVQIGRITSGRRLYRASRSSISSRC